MWKHGKRTVRKRRKARVREEFLDKEISRILSEGVEMNDAGNVVFGFLNKHRSEFKRYIRPGMEKLLRQHKQELLKEIEEYGKKS